MFRNEKGVALPLTLLVMLTLSLLGTAVWQYGVNDTIHVAREQQRMQAYYLARAGADATLQAWLQSPPSGRPNGTGGLVYLKNDDTFVTVDPGTAKAGQFSVSVATLADGSVQIVSTGDVRGLTQKVTVTLSASFIYGHTLGWYHENSGQMATGVTLPVATQPVILDANSGKIKLPSRNIDGTYDAVNFEAPALFFESGLDGPFHNRLNLKAEVIVFDQSSSSSIHMKENAGKLFLYVPSGMGITRPGEAGLWGAVYFPPSVKHGRDEVLHPQDNLMLGGRAFYFLQKDNGNEGIDILNIGYDELEEIPNPVVPRPDDYATIVWS